MSNRKSPKFYQDYVYLEEKLKNLEFDWRGKSVVDVGCNVGELYEYVKQRGARSYFGLDKREAEIQEAKRRYPEAKFYVGNILDYDNLVCDVMVFLAVFHHLSNKEEIIKVLKSLSCSELVVETPVKESQNPLDKHRKETANHLELREEEYRGLLETYFGKIVNRVESGFRERIIFVCKKDGNSKN